MLTADQLFTLFNQSRIVSFEESNALATSKSDSFHLVYANIFFFIRLQLQNTKENKGLFL